MKHQVVTVIIKLADRNHSTWTSMLLELFVSVRIRTWALLNDPRTGTKWCTWKHHKEGDEKDIGRRQNWEIPKESLSDIPEYNPSQFNRAFLLCFNSWLNLNLDCIVHHSLLVSTIMSQFTWRERGVSKGSIVWVKRFSKEHPCRQRRTISDYANAKKYNIFRASILKRETRASLIGHVDDLFFSLLTE